LVNCALRKGVCERYLPWRQIVVPGGAVTVQKSLQIKQQRTLRIWRGIGNGVAKSTAPSQ
jgi:hypothetical protein